MGGEESARMKEVASASLNEEQKEAQELLLKDQEKKQVEMDLNHAKAVNEMKQELDEDGKIAKDSIVDQMEEQKRKVYIFYFKSCFQASIFMFLLMAIHYQKLLL